MLVRRAERHPDRLSDQELEELVRLYLRTSAHLSTARTVHRDPALVAQLTRQVGRARAVVYGTRARTVRAIARFAVATFPAAVWHARRHIALAAGVFVLAALAVGAWIATTPAAFDAVAPPEVVAAYLEEDFEGYYSSRPAAEFATLVFTNNAQVGALAFAVGILFGLPTLLVLLFNGVNLGVAGGLFHAAGRAEHFWGLILPHGLLELTAIFVAGGAGLLLGWAVIAPGDRTRGEALTAEGQRCIVVVMGLVAVFLVAGLIEAFVTPSGWPTWARVGTGVVVEAGFVLYVVILGRRAAAAGLTGSLREATRPSLDAHAGDGSRRP